MTAQTTLAPAASPAPTTTEPLAARSQIEALLQSARSKAPTDLLADHLLTHYADAGFRILRAAAEAVVRRLQIVAEQGLVVQARPHAGVLGDYQTRRRRQQQRPYRTRLTALQPLVGSCDCHDFRANSLGLCKHLLAVLVDLARRPRTLERGRRLGLVRQPTPVLRWHAVKPLLGDGDWLRQVELLWPANASRVAAKWRAVARHFTEHDDGRLRLKDTHAEGKARLRLLDVLQHACKGSPTAGDPALMACIADERERLQVATDLQPLQTRVRGMRGFRRKLYGYQQQGVQRFLQSGRLVLADDMGLGKTTQAVAACHLLSQHDKVVRGLLVVPAPLKQQWQREWQACCQLPITEIEGSAEQRAACYRATKRGFLLTNYEQLLRDVDLAKQWRPDLVLLDEAQRIKNWQTKTAATIKQLEPRYRLVLTGTPFENRIVELDSILEWIDRRPLQPLWRLMPFHQLDDGAGLQHLDVLRERLAPVLLRRRRQEVLDQLPGRADTRIDVPMTPNQIDEHDARKQPIATLLKITERRPLTQPEFLRLMLLFAEQRIIANGMAQFAYPEVWPGIEKARAEPALLDGLSMPKLGELQLLLQQLVVEQGRKVVVFSQWRRALQLAAWAVRDMFDKASVKSAFFTGAQSVRRRNENIVAFHDDPAMRVLFATDAGGVGLNLQHAASCCVHFDLPWNPAVFEQRVGRIWRLGQTEKVDVYSLVSENCIESRMAEILRGKQAAFSALFDGDSDEVRFEQRGGFLAAARRLSSADEAEEWEELPEVADVVERPSAIDEAAAEGGQVGDATDDDTATAAPALDAGRVRSLLAGLTVKPRGDGGMVLEADRESAVVLAEVLRGLAGAIESAAGDR